MIGTAGMTIEGATAVARRRHRPHLGAGRRQHAHALRRQGARGGHRAARACVRLLPRRPRRRARRRSCTRPARSRHGRSARSTRRGPPSTSDATCSRCEASRAAAGCTVTSLCSRFSTRSSTPSTSRCWRPAGSRRAATSPPSSPPAPPAPGSEPGSSPPTSPAPTPATSKRSSRPRADETTLVTDFSVLWPNGPEPHRVLTRSIDAARAAPTDTVGEIIAFGERRPVPRFAIFPPTADVTGDIDAFAMYAGTSVGSITSIEPAADASAPARRPRRAAAAPHLTSPPAPAVLPDNLTSRPGPRGPCKRSLQGQREQELSPLGATADADGRAELGPGDGTWMRREPGGR